MVAVVVTVAAPIGVLGALTAIIIALPCYSPTQAGS